MRLRGFLGRHYPVMAVATVYLACLAILPLDGIWINDVGSRIIQVESIGASGYSDFSIRWPGATIDPSLDYAPIAYPFAVVRGATLYSVYSPVLATLASPFFKIFGHPGLYVLPFAASIVMLVGLGKLAEETSSRGRAREIAILVAGLCTPIWFYSLTFWEHTIAACFCVWSLVHLMRFLRGRCRRDLAAAAALSAVATYFRPELYTFVLVLLGAVMWRVTSARLKSGALFAATAVAALVPLWLFHWAALGQPLGLHLGTLVSSTSGIVQHVRSRPVMFLHQFLLCSFDYRLSLVFAAPFVVLFFTRPRLSEKAFSTAVPLLGLAGLVLFLLIWISFRSSSQPGSPIAVLGRTNSLFPTAPLLILGLARLRGDEQDRTQPHSCAHTLWMVAVLYALVYWLAAPGITKWGVHWGNRYLLVLYPLLAVLVAGNLVDWQARLDAGLLRRALARAAVASVVAVSFAAQVWSVSVLERKMDFSSRLNREVGARSEQVVVTSLWWVGQELYGQFQDKMIFWVRTDQQYSDLVRRLAENGYLEYLAVLPASEPVPTWWGSWSQPVRVSDDGVGNWDVNLVGLEVKAGRR